MRTEAKHFFSGSVTHTDAPKDYDGQVKDVTPTDSLASSLRTCVITTMGIEAKRRGWELGNIQLDVDKITMTNGLKIKDPSFRNVHATSNRL